MDLADALVCALRDWDVRYVFGVSGANIEHLHDAIRRHGDGRLSSVLARREDGAAFMADARARVHRVLGVCCSTSGAAMMNLAVGLAESHAESVPVLAIVGVPPTTLEGRGAFQDSSGLGRSVDALALLRAMTKYAAKVTDPKEFWGCLREAVTQAVSGRPGAAALLVPRDMNERDVGDRPADWPASLAALATPAPPDAEAVRDLFFALRGARAPVLLLGHGVRRSADPPAVVRFARHARIPVVTTMSARAEFPNDDPLYLGVVGAAGHPSAHAFIRDRADLVVIAGAGFNGMTRAPFGVLDPKKLAAVNVDPGEIVRAVAPARVVRADVGLVFQLLESLLEESPFLAPPVGPYELRRFAPRLAPPIASPGVHSRADAGGDTLLQSEALAILEAHLPRKGHLMIDAGNCASAAIHLTRVPAGTTSTIALGGGGMGYGIAAAIGAQLGSPAGTRSVVLCGDGAFLVSGLEVHTAVDLRLPVLFVVFNNQMHGMCATRQQLFFDSRIECVQYAPVDVATVASGLGSPATIWVGSAGSGDELRRALADYAARGDVPGVLELRLSREEVPPFAMFLPEGEPTVPVAR